MSSGFFLHQQVKMGVKCIKVPTNYSHVTWVFWTALKSSGSKHLNFINISVDCIIPTHKGRTDFGNSWVQTRWKPSAAWRRDEKQTTEPNHNLKTSTRLPWGSHERLESNTHTTQLRVWFIVFRDHGPPCDRAPLAWRRSTIQKACSTTTALNPCRDPFF